MPVFSLALFSQGRAFSPFPSKPPGLVRGFHTPALKMWQPLAASCVAVVMTCFSVSAEHGPAITNGLPPSQGRANGCSSNSIGGLLFFSTPCGRLAVNVVFHDFLTIGVKNPRFLIVLKRGLVLVYIFFLPYLRTFLEAYSFASCSMCTMRSEVLPSQRSGSDDFFHRPSSMSVTHSASFSASSPTSILLPTFTVSMCSV